MPRLPVISGDEFAKAVRKIGYVWDHTEGSHYFFTHPTDRTIHFSVAHHPRDMKRSTLAKTLKQAKLSLAEFLRHDP